MKLKYMDVGEPTTLEEVLDNREKRVIIMESIKDKYKNSTVICFKLNIPGPIKNNEKILDIYQEGKTEIKNILNKESISRICEQEYKNTTGPEYYVATTEEPKLIKKLMIDLEERSHFGRLYDIDVESIEGAVSRKDLSLNSRKCFLCDRDAKNCARSRRHSVHDMLLYIEELIDTYTWS